MVDFIFSLLFLAIGVFLVYSAYKSSKTKEVKINIDKIINPAMIRNKEQYIKSYCKWNYILGAIATIEGVVGLTSCYVPSMHFGFNALNIIFLLAIFAYMVRIISMLCKS